VWLGILIQGLPNLRLRVRGEAGWKENDHLCTRELAPTVG
jgi:hypothetical protein